MPTLNPNNTLRIEQYSFHEFLSEFQQAVIDGFILDLDNNEHFPQKFGDYLSVTLVPTQWTIDEDEEAAIKQAVESGVVSRDNLSASQLEAAYQADVVVYTEEDVKNHLADETVLAPYSNVDEPSGNEVEVTTTFSPEVVQEVKKAGRPRKN